MTRYAAVLTTSAWDPFVQAQLAHTASRVGSGDVFVLANETQGPLAIPESYRSLAVSESRIRELGLQIQYDQTLFCYNVDYLFIYFFLNHPDFDYYVFFDYPALIDVDVDAMVESARQDGIDFIAEPIPEPLADWVYTGLHGALYPADVLRGAMLPVAVLSKAAVSHLASRRLALSRDFEAAHAGVWPFCEAFVPTELALAGFKAAPLSAFGSVEHFRWWPPTLDSALPARRAPGFVHPLLDRPRYLTSMLRHSGLRDLFSFRTHARMLRHLSLGEYMAPLLGEIGTKAAQAVRSRMPMRRAPSLWERAAQKP